MNGATVTGSAEGTLFYGSDLAGQTIADGGGNAVQASKATTS